MGLKALWKLQSVKKRKKLLLCQYRGKPWQCDMSPLLQMQIMLGWNGPPVPPTLLHWQLPSSSLWLSKVPRALSVLNKVNGLQFAGKRGEIISGASGSVPCSLKLSIKRGAMVGDCQCLCTRCQLQHLQAVWPMTLRKQLPYSLIPCTQVENSSNDETHLAEVG